LSDQELSKGVLRYASGIEVKGRFLECIRKEGRGLIARFADCTVHRGSEILYRPEWGVFDLPLGISIPSVYGGAGDRVSFLKAGGPLHPPGRPKSNLTQANVPLNKLYAIVREARESPRPGDEAALREVARALDSGFPSDWLLPLELLELEKIRGTTWAWLDPARARVEAGAVKRDVVGTLLRRGLEAGGMA
jgi:phenylalanine-4-hydroxylase